MPITEGERLAQAVRDGDATARAVYADWLEQQGDRAMATFVRAGGLPVSLAEADQQLTAVLVELFEHGPVYKRRGLDLHAEFAASPHPYAGRSSA